MTYDAYDIALLLFFGCVVFALGLPMTVARVRLQLRRWKAKAAKRRRMALMNWRRGWQ